MNWIGHEIESQRPTEREWEMDAGETAMSDSIPPMSRLGAAGLTPLQRASYRSTTVNGTVRSSDSVEFSKTAQLLSKLAELPDVRQELVDRVRSQISSGTYETPEKLDAAIENLLGDLNADRFGR